MALIMIRCNNTPGPCINVLSYLNDALIVKEKSKSSELLWLFINGVCSWVALLKCYKSLAWQQDASLVEDISERRLNKHVSILCKTTWGTSRMGESFPNRSLGDEYVTSYIKSFISRNKYHLYPTIIRRKQSERDDIFNDVQVNYR